MDISLKRSELIFVAALGLAAAGGCNGADTSAPSPAVHMALEFSDVTVGLRAVQPIAVTYRNASDSIVSAPPAAVWTTSDASVAAVDQSGNVTGVALGGPVTVTLVNGDLTASVRVTVTPFGIAINPTDPFLPLGQKVQLSATPLDFFGDAISGAATGAVTWFSTNTAVAAVDAATGLVTSIAPGNTSIGVSTAGKTNKLDLEIGVPSAYDGTWTGPSNCLSCGDVAVIYPVTMTVRFGLVRSFHVASSRQPDATACPLELDFGGSTVTPLTQSQFTMTFPLGLTVTAEAGATTITGTHTSAAVSCPGNGNGFARATIGTGAFTLTKQQ